LRKKKTARSKSLVVSSTSLPSHTVVRLPISIRIDPTSRISFTSLRAIAKSAGKSERHVSQVIRAAFLAPDLVQALLQGRQPAQLTLPHSHETPALDWIKQRRQFGVAPGINDSLSVRDSPWSVP
jgi:hypothetical protein